ncbi:MAG: WYL domain-containing protein [Chordicoccus sp.]
MQKPSRCPAKHFSGQKCSRRDLAKYKTEHQSFSFRCLLTPSGKEQFLKSDYFGMTLREENEKLILTGKIEEQDKDYLLQYLISFGANIKILYPKSLIRDYLRALSQIAESYSES